MLMISSRLCAKMVILNLQPLLILVLPLVLFLVLHSSTDFWILITNPWRKTDVPTCFTLVSIAITKATDEFLKGVPCLEGNGYNFVVRLQLLRRTAKGPTAIGNR